MTVDELTEVVTNVRYVERAIANTKSKDISAEELTDIRQKFNKSIYARIKKNKGDVITREDIGVFKPSIGISAKYLDLVIGSTLSKDVEAGQPIFAEYLDDFGET